MKTALDYANPEAPVFWSAGLDGRNQIVGIGDSGIDMDSCFFNDPAVPFAAPTAGKEWANDQHRKVVYYWGLADDAFRDLVGHGTHTAGSIAGYNPAAPDSKATGAARAARLAFVDLSRTAGGDVNVPPDLENNYFSKMRARGACIFSGEREGGSMMVIEHRGVCAACGVCSLSQQTVPSSRAQSCNILRHCPPDG